MNMKTMKALLETLIYAIEQAVVIHDHNALLLITHIFRVILDQEKEFTLKMLQALVDALPE